MAVYVNGVTCDECSVQYRSELVPAFTYALKRVPAPPSESIAESELSEAHAAELWGQRRRREGRKLVERATAGETSLELSWPRGSLAYGQHADQFRLFFGDRELRVPRDRPNPENPDEYIPPLFDAEERRLTFPIPPEVVAGLHTLRVVVDRWKPAEDEAHGEAMLRRARSGGLEDRVFLPLRNDDGAVVRGAQVRIAPRIESLSHMRAGSEGGAQVTIHGSGFSPLRSENVVLLAGRGCAVVHAEHHLLKCVLLGSGESLSGEWAEVAPPAPTATTDSVFVAVRGCEATTSQGGETVPFELDASLSARVESLDVLEDFSRSSPTAAVQIRGSNLRQYAADFAGDLTAGRPADYDVPELFAFGGGADLSSSSSSKFAFDATARERSAVHKISCKSNGTLATHNYELFECAVPLPPCGDEEQRNEQQQERLPVGLRFKGSGWAIVAPGVTMDWPIGCVPQTRKSTDVLAAQQEDRRSAALSRRRRLADDNPGCLFWSDVLDSSYAGDASYSDVYVNTTLVVDADMDVQWLIVSGTLRWDTAQDGLTLRAKSIMVIGNGTFELGSEQEPMLNEARIFIKRSNETDSVLADDDAYSVDTWYYNDSLAEYYEPYVGVRAFAACGGSTCGGTEFDKPTIRIVGKPLARTWSELNATVAAGNTKIELVHNPTDMGWKAGGRIAIATTAGVGNGGESVTYTISAVAPSGAEVNWVELDSPILHDAIGKLLEVSRQGIITNVRLAAEVIYLSRSVVVSGSAFDSSESGDVGMHILVAFQGFLQIACELSRL